MSQLRTDAWLYSDKNYKYIMAAYYINIRTCKHYALQDTAQPEATEKLRD